MFHETYKLVLQLVKMTWGSVNRFVEMLLFCQYFNIFLLNVFFFFKSLKAEKDIPESKPDQKQFRTEFQKFSFRK